MWLDVNVDTRATQNGTCWLGACGCGRGLGSGKGGSEEGVGVLGRRDSSDCIAFSWSAKPGFLSRATGTLSPPFPSRAGPGVASPFVSAWAFL